MGRWEPDARGRLERAALELYLERGFERTSVAEIAERAGLTERTFFRHYADKREVLFGGSSALQELLVRTVARAPEPASPMEAVMAAVLAAAAVMQERQEHSRRRQAVIAANTELQERELIKLASLGAAIADALRRRGVDEASASLAAEAGIAVFKIAFRSWTEQAEQTEQAADQADQADQAERAERAEKAGQTGQTGQVEQGGQKDFTSFVEESFAGLKAVTAGT
ncbi:TetR/AcrR family transcriptional regulator [Sphaerisporangium corydalis]|uniref:TetR/AcrR family transcriptional regulator n=1 Tax=Sphaerisporangium corydalis TaxID=1441875 RepID=A0ABV9EJ47_9ACTN|nr:TetR/AcrR family transcriptional regulator [Sphaerisporangium corydalis]